MRFGRFGHSAVLRTLLLSGSLNRWIRDAALLHPNILLQTSHVLRTLTTISYGGEERHEPKNSFG